MAVEKFDLHRPDPTATTLYEVTVTAGAGGTAAGAVMLLYTKPAVLIRILPGRTLSSANSAMRRVYLLILVLAATGHRPGIGGMGDPPGRRSGPRAGASSAKRGAAAGLHC